MSKDKLLSGSALGDVTPFLPRQPMVRLGDDAAPPKPDPVRDLGFVDQSPTLPSRMRGSIHRSHRGEGNNFVD